MTGLPRKIGILTDARAWGGAEVYLLQLAEAVRDAGWDLSIFCADRPAAAGWVRELEGRGLRVVRYRPTKEYNPLGYFVARRLLRGLDVVHVNKTAPRNSLPAIVAARRSGAAVVLATEHLAGPAISHYPFGQAAVTRLVRWTNGMLDMTIAVSELSRDALVREYGLDPSKVVVIGNGVDLARFDRAFDVGAVRSDLGIGRDDRVVTLIGELCDRKGQRYALEAAPRIRERVPGLKLLFVGGGGLERELRDAAERLGVSDVVVFAGVRRDVPAILAASDLLILPSEDECFPFAILEAMASRLPVVASDVGGIRDAVEHGVTGLVVAPCDVGALARAVTEVLSDPRRAKAMGSAGRAKVEAEFSVKVCTNAVLRLYEELLSRRADGAAGSSGRHG
ncbi:MAG: glycosyltransferase family 4 protein [Candidatus Eisenbacteria bacterium]|nr:glycosyltransferase family 4 protein [Candidatus Eisenbacteria bacterium]